MTRAPKTVEVADPFGVRADSSMPSLALALDPVLAREEFKRGLARLSGDDGRVSVRAIRVTRHKPGKRCVIEYDLKVRRRGLPDETLTVLGKIRANRFGNEAYRLQDVIWSAGFQSDSADGVSVPEPLGVIPTFQMWVQRKVPGVVSGRLLAGAGGAALARRVAEALHKLHRAGVPTGRVHVMADELRILQECLTGVAGSRPHLAERVSRVRLACDELGASAPPPQPCGIHRDFYPAQVVVDGTRVHLIDFDLYCLGDPALDAGNFIGHMTEESLRTLGHADALRDREQALEERFAELAGERTRAAVRTYTTLTLARHIYLSTRFPERTPFTERLLALCEERLGCRGRR